MNKIDVSLWDFAFVEIVDKSICYHIWKGALHIEEEQRSNLAFVPSILDLVYQVM